MYPQLLQIDWLSLHHCKETPEILIDALWHGEF